MFVAPHILLLDGSAMLQMHIDARTTSVPTQGDFLMAFEPFTFGTIDAPAPSSSTTQTLNAIGSVLGPNTLQNNQATLSGNESWPVIVYGCYVVGTTCSPTAPTVQLFAQTTLGGSVRVLNARQFLRLKNRHRLLLHT